jgi:O-acetyl-ADP-ribose deacetylase (regulator of RNase III)
MPAGAGKKIHGTELRLTLGDITKQEVDAIVNAANSGLLGGGGVDGAIHRAAGPQLLAECKQILAATGRCPPGQAVITGGGNLPARYVIHTVGPIWHGGKRDEADILASAYTESLMLAESRGAKTVAFPSISTGAYSYPVADAASVAIGAVADYLGNGSKLSEVRFVLFDEHTFDAYQRVLDKLGAC